MLNGYSKAVKLMIMFVAVSCIEISCNNSSGVNTNTSHKKTDTIATATNNTATNNIITNKDGTTINPDWLLIPGVSAGQTRLNENADSVYKRLGKPDGGDAAMMKAIVVWYNHHDTTNNSIAIYTSKNTDTPVVARIKQIRVTSPAFKTAEDIHTTSTLQEIKGHFVVTKTEQYSYAGASYAVYDSKQGIAFEAAPDSTCTAIIIHEAGTINEGTYLKFRTTGKYVNP